MKRVIALPGVAIYKGSAQKVDEKIFKDSRGYVPTIVGVAQISGRNIDFIPYKDTYRPVKGDYVIGVVVGYAPNGWFIDIGSYVKAFLPAADVLNKRFDPRKDELSRYLKIGDIVGLYVSEVRRLGNILVTMKDVKKAKDRRVGRLSDYYMIKVWSTKLPRIIGKKGSMVKLLKERLGGDIIIAQNGVILYKGPYEKFVILNKIITFITAKTFATGLTEYINGLINDMLGTEDRNQDVEGKEGS